MNEHREEKGFCYFHPKELVVGVCHLCLNERLLILAASKQGHLQQHSKSILRSHSFRNRKPTFPNIFALGSLLSRHPKSDNYDSDDASTTREDSFISIKFEDNGVASWEKDKVSKVPLDQCNVSWNHSLKEDKTVVEHAKPRGASLRWRKRIGHVFQLIKLKRSNKGNVCHVGSSKLEGVKVRNGWIRILTKGRSKE